MKKFLVMTMAGLFTAGISSCKSDYECCSTVDGSDPMCFTVADQSKSDIEDLEEAGTTTIGGISTTYKCEKK